MDNPRARLRLPYGQDFELIPFIGEDGDKYIRVFVDRLHEQTVKVRGFAIHSIEDPGNLSKEMTRERY